MMLLASIGSSIPVRLHHQQRVTRNLPVNHWSTAKVDRLSFSCYGIRPSSTSQVRHHISKPHSASSLLVAAHSPNSDCAVATICSSRFLQQRDHSDTFAVYASSAPTGRLLHRAVEDVAKPGGNSPFYKRSSQASFNPQGSAPHFSILISDLCNSAAEDNG